MTTELQKRISDAQEILTEAERELELLIHGIHIDERADKKIIGEALSRALQRVIAARTHLASVVTDSGG